MFMVLLAFSLFITGCSSEKAGMPDGQDMFRGDQNMPKREMFREGFNEEQRKQMFKEMQQKSIDACNNKNKGDSCTIEGRIGEMQGTCSVENENLLCRFERPDMPFRPRPE